MSASVWYGIAKGMIDRGVMTEVALDALLRIKKITAAEHAELTTAWIAKINPSPPAPTTPAPEPTEEADGGEVATPGGPVDGPSDDGPGGGPQS